MRARMPIFYMVTVAEFVKFVKCVEARLRDSGYSVDDCSEIEVPNCLAVGQGGRSYRLTFGVVGDEPTVGIVSDGAEAEVDVGDVYAIHAAIDSCLPALGGGSTS